jgi:6-phosphogluconolactonase/glucosamine-6-phosphate isomerase/deaminase
MNKKESFAFTPFDRSPKIENSGKFAVPQTRYFKTKDEFDIAVGQDFIDYANETTGRGQKFLVGLAHGESPAGAYQYIFDHFDQIKAAKLIRFTFTNSRLLRQRDLEDVMDARVFVTRMLRRGLITKDQILGRSLNRDNIDEYTKGFNQKLGSYLAENKKNGFDYVFLSFDPTGRVAGVSRNSEAFDSDDLVVLVNDMGEPEITGTPRFLGLATRIAFLATKADKRRPLAWLYHRSGKKDQSPSFLRHLNNVEDRMTVFVNDEALTWPQIEIERQTKYGVSTIRLDLAKPYDEDAEEKLPVILLIHGFLGLNSFDSTLTELPTHHYIGAAFHYGSIPHDLPPHLYSQHVVKNIDRAVSFFGARGHPVYIFDHSMGNTYFMLMDRDYESLEGIKKYLRGRIGSNPFFCRNAKHAFLGFLDNVLIPAVSYRNNTAAKTMLVTLRRLVPLDSRKGVRRRGVKLTDWLIRKDSPMREQIWQAAKDQVIHLMTKLESVPHLDRIPIERALSRLPAKIFVIQVHAALKESESHDKQKSLSNMLKYDIPILILKSERDSIAKFAPELHQTHNVTILDVTNKKEKDLFREHLYHMVNPVSATKIMMDFVDKNEAKLKAK